MSCLLSCCASCCTSLTCGLCTSVASGITQRSARIAYCGLFGASLIVSWILREVATSLLGKISWINTSGTRSEEFLQIQAVLRVSLGKFLFFSILALIMIGVKDRNDRRDAWHHSGCIAKIMIWVLLVVLMLFLPDVVFLVYGLFLLVQVIVLLDFDILGMIHGSRKMDRSGEWKLVACICDFRLLCFCAPHTGLYSEPHDYACNGLGHSKAVTITTLVLGLLTTVLSVLYSALRAGSSTSFLSPPSSPKSGGKKPLLEAEEVEQRKGKKEEKEGEPVRYSYSFFHLIFALASMYSAMLLSGWTSSFDSSGLIDIGWTSVWVRICTEWPTAALYVWTIVAPLVLPDREFS